MKTLALVGWVLGLGPALLPYLARAQESELPSLPATAVSQMYPGLTCMGTNAEVNADVLQLASDTRSELAPILNLGPHWRFPVHINVVMPDDPAAGKIREERVAVTLADGTLNLEAALPGNETGAHDFIQRQFVTALLWEKFFANTKSFDSKTNLGVVPIWLVVGLSEWLSEDTDHSRQEIVQRASRIHRAPTLRDIMSWQEINPDRLLGLYQRAFCFYLVNSLIHGEAKRETFQQWLAAFAGPDPGSATYLFPTEAAWQQELQEAPERTHDIVYTWDETSTALADAESILIPSREPGNARICTLDNVLVFPIDAGLRIALPKKIFDLTALELRAHPSWRPILASYRFGLSALMQGHAELAQKFIQQAQQARVRETEFHSRLTDYVNWFEVTKDFQGMPAQFQGYFSTAKAMEEVQADPQRPNPLRADLIHAESRL